MATLDRDPTTLQNTDQVKESQARLETDPMLKESCGPSTRPAAVGFLLLVVAVGLIVALDRPTLPADAPGRIRNWLGIPSIAQSTATVPNVVGQRASIARFALRDAGFEIAPLIRVPDEDLENEGLVVATSPEAGQEWPIGSIVTITVAAAQAAPKGSPSGGETRGDRNAPPVNEPETASGSVEPRLPDVVGRETAEAAALLAGYKVVTQVSTVDAEPGDVVAMDPAAGTALRMGATVTLTIAAAPPSSYMVRVPDLIGMTKTGAITAVLAAGLTPRIDFSPIGGPPERVLAQQPVAEALARPGTDVTITVREPALPSPSVTPAPDASLTPSPSPS
jgi:serine/threonine-protein kinase